MFSHTAYYLVLFFLRYGSLYNQENLAISGTHTHAGPGGYLQYVVYSITSLGFVHQSFDAIVDAIEQSIVQAHNNLKPGSILINKGEIQRQRRCCYIEKKRKKE